MPSIRKTKKRLKRELAEAQKAFAECDCVFLADAIQKDMDMIELDLEKLKYIRKGWRKIKLFKA